MRNSVGVDKTSIAVRGFAGMAGPDDFHFVPARGETGCEPIQRHGDAVHFGRKSFGDQREFHS